MRIGFTTLGADGGRSGIGQYAVRLIDEFARHAPHDDVEVLAHPSERDAFVGSPARLPVRPVSDAVRSPMANILWHQVGLPAACRRGRYDVVFLPAANRRVPLRLPCPTVGTVHDFSALHVEGKYDRARTFYITRVLPRLVRGLDQVITDSESSKRDIVDHAGVPERRVHVIPLAADTAVFAPRDRGAAARRVAAAFGIPQPYVVYVSRLEHPGKNHVRLIEAFARLRREARLPHRLVLAGSDWSGADEVHRAAEASDARDAIVFTGYVAADALPDLYAAAAMMICPSLYEGFGMPVLEAMATGTAVACANVSSLPEVAGDAARLFDPLDVDDIAGAMREVLTEPGVRAVLQERGLARSREFSWRECAARTLDVLRLAAKGRAS